VQEEIGVVTHWLGEEGERRFTRASIRNSAKTDNLNSDQYHTFVPHNISSGKVFHHCQFSESSKTFSASSC
jgi:hypothetical protein